MSDNLRINKADFSLDRGAARQGAAAGGDVIKSSSSMTMYNGTKAVKSWTTGYTDSGSIRTWKVSYTFTGTGKKTMTFKVSNEAGESAAKKATIEITK